MAARGTSRRILTAVERLLKLADVTEPPVPVEEIARLRGADLRYVPYKGDISGLLSREHGRVIIGINGSHSKRRQRFTIAHELGHLELHRDKELHIDRGFPVFRRDSRSSTATDPAEMEANAFAAELLMPSAMIRNDLAGAVLDFEDDGVLRRLADKYEVSLQAMIIRLTRLGVIDDGAGGKPQA